MSEFPRMMYAEGAGDDTDQDIWGVMRQVRIVNDRREKLEATREGFVEHPHDLDPEGAHDEDGGADEAADLDFDEPTPEPEDVIGDAPADLEASPPVPPRRGPGRPPKAKD